MAKGKKNPGSTTPIGRNPKADGYFHKATQWRAELEQLRAIALGCQLTEELKWSKPCYTLNGSNVVILIPFKESCALMFCQGALLKDARGLLLKPGENTQAGRWLKFTALGEILAMEAVVKAYVLEAIAAEKAGLKVKLKKSTEFKNTEELQKKLDEEPALKAAFAALTPGRQRAYNLFFSAAKQSTTRVARVEKCRGRILKGKGLND